MGAQPASTLPAKKPEQVTKQGGDRYYTWTTGEKTERYWSATTIVKQGIPKGEALMNWAVNTTAGLAVDNIDLLQIMLERGQREAAVDYLRQERFRVTDRARITGTEIHAAIEAYKLEQPFPGVPEDVADYYGGFVMMMKEEQPVVLLTEAKVYNRSRKYAGQLDAVMIFPKLAALVPKSCPSCRAKADLGTGHADDCTTPDLPVEQFTHGDPRGPVVLVDYKTGKGPKKGGVYSETALQLAAYANGEFIGGPDGKEYPMPPQIDAAVAIHLQPGWCEIVPVHIGPEVFQHFLFGFETLRWTQEISKRVIGRPVAVYSLPAPELVRPEFVPKQRISIHRVALSRVPKPEDDLPRHAVRYDPDAAPRGKAFVALCGVAVRHVTAEGFDPTGRRSCADCAAEAVKELAAHEAGETPATEPAPEASPKAEQPALSIVKDEAPKDEGSDK